MYNVHACLEFILLSLSMHLDLNAVLDKAEELFYKYCTMCVDKSCYVELNC